jgi:hypothetical protein
VASYSGTPAFADGVTLVVPGAAWPVKTNRNGAAASAQAASCMNAALASRSSAVAAHRIDVVIGRLIVIRSE